MAQVGIIMGSQSDWPTMKAAAEVLDELGIRMELEIPDDAKERWHQLVSQANSQSDAVLSSGSAT